MLHLLREHRLLRLFARSLLPLLLLETLHLALESQLSLIGTVERWAFVVSVLLAGHWLAGFIDWLHRPAGLLLGAAALLTLVMLQSHLLLAAWVLLGYFFLLLFSLDSLLLARLPARWGWGIHGFCAFLAGVVPVVFVQVESRFADEEFFVILEVCVLALLWLMLRSVAEWQRVHTVAISHPDQPPVRPWILPLALLVACVIGGAGTIGAYQQSFYPEQAPPYSGISASAPFLCDAVEPAPSEYEGIQVFENLLAQVAANPAKAVPEYGMLALGTGDRFWRELFREEILAEAAQGRFAHAANSVKWIQYQAGLRAYYLARVNDHYPDLFTSADRSLLFAWMADINRRAQTVEWVDWMYGLAFSKFPEGLYENQENGAGLLSLLQANGMNDPSLSSSNVDYLRRNQRGWFARFRNTDDTFLYQAEWITNAYFQSFFQDESDPLKKRFSFEWLLFQALPDGAFPSYNHVGRPSLAGIAYLGALLLNDPHYLWLAGQALDKAAADGVLVFAQPGAEYPVQLVGRSPSTGSCLLYGDSGLPNQLGPLAPDKIIFRNSWSSGSTYLSLNLRFSGWHRYKATNDIIQLDWRGPLVVERTKGQPLRWLPVGRSLLRDKRIGRENLNGLLIEKSGLSAILYNLTGMGSPWAQDPPYYAEVVDFQIGDDLDWSHTRLSEWRGWQHDRWVYVYQNDGPIAVVDRAEGPAGQQSALSWHLATSGNVVADTRRIQLRDGADPVELVLIPLGNPDEAQIESKRAEDQLDLTYQQASDGSLAVVSLFLLGDWRGAQVELENGSASQLLRITQGSQTISLPIPSMTKKLP